MRERSTHTKKDGSLDTCRPKRETTKACCFGGNMKKSVGLKHEYLHSLKNLLQIWCDRSRSQFASFAWFDLSYNITFKWFMWFRWSPDLRTSCPRSNVHFLTWLGCLLFFLQMVLFSFDGLFFFHLAACCCFLFPPPLVFFISKLTLTSTFRFSQTGFCKNVALRELTLLKMAYDGVAQAKPSAEWLDSGKRPARPKEEKHSSS